MEDTNRGKVVVVTGASAGVGRAVVTEFARQGGRIGLIARGRERLEATKREVEELGGKALVLPVDVADAQQVEKAAERVEEELGPIDIWVNDAMETVFSRFVDITPDEFKRATEVTYLGFVYGTMEAMKRMAPRNRGHIIQVGSALAYRSIPLQSPYCGGKFAVRGFTDSLRCELIHDHSPIKLSMVHMPALNTPQFSWARTHIERQPKPVGTIFQPEVGADAVVHAARYPRREYWVGGSTIAAILGNKVFPGWMDRIMARESYEQQWVKDKKRPLQDGNLFKPADLNLHKTHGQFDAEATTRSPTWDVMKWLSKLGG